MLSPVDGLCSMDPFHMIEKDIPDFEKPEPKKSLLERLLDCYNEQSRLEKQRGESTKESYLLAKIVKEDNLSVLIVNLYAGNDGYSLMLKKKDNTEVETVKLPYEENEFLEYLDMQQLPPLLVDVLESVQVDIYHDGCVIVELRDYRRSTQKNYDITYVLLKPTSQTIVRDVNAMMADTSKWNDEDKAMLESQLVLAMQPRLCLDPSPSVLYTANKIQYHANKWNHKGLKRSMKRFSQPYLNRAVLCSNTPSPPCLRLLDFIQRNRDKRSSLPKLNRATQHTDMWKQRSPTLSVPTKIDVTSYSKLHEQPKYTTDYTPEKIQEIILEGEKTNNRSYFCRVTIQRRGSTGEYLGDLYLEEDHGAQKENTHKDGRACRFSLGNRLTAQRYLQQFQELYTEEGRKSVKISTFVANQSHQQKSQSSSTQSQQSTSATTASSQHPNNTKPTVASSSIPTTSESTLTVNLTRSLGPNQNSVLSQGGNTYILASSVQGQPFNIGSNVVMSIPSSLAQSLVSGNATFSVSGNPYFVNASGNLQQSSKSLQSPSKPVVSGTSMSVSSHGQLTAVPIAVQGNNVSIVSGNMNAQFIAKATPQAIRPAGATGQIMLQNVASTQLGQRLQASFAVPGNLVPISQMTRVGGQQKGLAGPGMPSVMVHGKQVMVQGSPAMIQGQATFIPSQTPLIPGLQSGQTAIIQGGSIFVQGQPGQSLVGGQAQGQTVMIQGQPGQSQHNQNALLQGQALQGQAVFIQGQPNGGGQAIMLQNQGGHQGQVQIITTTSSSGQQLQIVPQIQQKGGASSASGRVQSSTALSALTSQVNLIPVQQGGQQQYQPIVQFTPHAQQPRPVTQRRRSSTQPTIIGGGKKRPPAPTKQSPS